MTNFSDPVNAAHLVGLWDFRNGAENKDTGLADGVAQNGHFEGNAAAVGEQLALDGRDDWFDTAGDDHPFDLAAGTIEVQFTQDEHVGTSPDTIVNRGEFCDKSHEGWFGIQLTQHGSVTVYHEMPDGTVASMCTPNGFFTSDTTGGSDTLNVVYTWDEHSGATFTVTNLSTGDVFTDSVHVTGLTMAIGDNDDENFTFGAREFDDGAYDKEFDGWIDYVAVYDKVIPGGSNGGTSSSTPDYIVEGTAGADLIDVNYTGDPEGDSIDAGDNLDLNDQDVVDAGAGDDTVISERQPDTIFAGTGDDSVFGAGGDDVIYGDSSLGQADANTATVRESFEWDLAPDLNGGGLNNGDPVGNFTQNTGSVDVQFAIGPASSGVQHEFESTLQNVADIDGGAETVDTNSSFYSETGGSGRSATYTLDFNAPGTTDATEVENVQFRINDIDGDGVVRVTAFDADGNPVEVELTAGSNLTLTDPNTADSNGGYLSDAAPEYSLLVEIAGPVHSIVVEHSQNGVNNSGVQITDVFFDAPVVGGPEGPGDDTLQGGAGDDLIYGETGDDSIIGNGGADTLFGDDPAEGTPIGPNLIRNGSFEETSGMTATGYGFVGNGAIPGWTDANGEAIDVHNDDRGGVLPTDGDNWLDLEASPGNNLIGQDVTGVQDGTSYLLTFDAGDAGFAPQSGSGENLINVYWGGALIATIDPNPGTMDSYQFVVEGGAGDGSNRLEFEGLGTEDNFGASVDSVSLVQLSSSTGAAGNDTIKGDGGADLIAGQDGSDDLFGGDDDDTIIGGSGDEIVGGEGSDSIVIDASELDENGENDGPITVDGSTEGSDQDTLDLTGFVAFRNLVETPDADGDSTSGSVEVQNADGEWVPVTFTEIETLLLPPKAPDGIVDGEDFGETMGLGYDDANAPTDGGGDLITDGDDVIEGNGGDDSINAAGGNDTVDGGTGNDTVNGNQGNDLVDGGEGDDLVTGGVGDDTVLGGAGNDELRGNGGDDSIDGGDGNDSMGGAEGDDTVLGGAGEDTLSGGSGNDVMDGGADDDTINGNSGNDEITDLEGDNLVVSGNVDTVTGISDGLPDVGFPFVPGTADPNPDDDKDTVTTGDGNDTIFTGDDDDVIDAGNGDNVIDAGYDDDSITTGSGNDQIIGGEGDDTIFSGDGDDIITGGLGIDSVNITDDGSDTTFPGPDPLPGNSPVSNGDDFIDAGAGNDIVFGEDDNDTIFGGEGNDILDGGIDDDSVSGGDGIDVILGGQGEDTLDGGADTDLILGGDDDDTITGGAGVDILDGESGNDLVDGGADTDLILGEDGEDTLIGGDGEDIVLGGTEDDIIYGDGTVGEGNTAGGGADILFGEDGDDTIIGGTGDDTIDGAEGADVMSGGDDQDTFIEVGPGDVIDGGEGGVDFDTIILSGPALIEYDPLNPENGTITFIDLATQSPIGTATFTNIENVTFVQPDANPPLAENDENSDPDTQPDDVVISFDPPVSPLPAPPPPAGGPEGHVDGTSGADVMGPGYVDADGDIMDGNDAILTGEFGDDDIVRAYGGDDTIFSGEGNDEVFGGDGDDQVDAGNGDDVVRGQDGDDTLAGGAGDDRIRGDDGNDVILGQDGDDVVEGNDGDDVIDGGDGLDYLDGGSGNDSIVGGAGQDLMAGQGGNDTLDGSDDTDADQAAGGDDADLFVNFGIGDTITGGEGGDDNDTLDLTGSGPLTVNFTGGDPTSESGTVTFWTDNTQTTVAGTLTFSEIENVIPCFTPGALIATPKGEVPVESLREGDKVITRDNGIQEIRWVGNRTLNREELAKAPNLKPVLIKAGSLGYGLPERDMLVSPQHRVLIAGDRTQLYFDESEVLVAAKHLVNHGSIQTVDTLRTTYIHFMFDRHEVVLSDGAWTESFQPGDQTLGAMGQETRDEIVALFPELATQEGITDYTAARRSLKAHEAKLLQL